MMVKVSLNSEVAKATPKSNVAVGIAAGVVGLAATRFVWKKFKNRKAQK